MKNKILYENWVKNQKEEDKVFVFDNGILIVFFERMLNFKLDDNLISMFTFKSKYRKQTALICNHLNYFVKFYFFSLLQASFPFLYEKLQTVKFAIKIYPIFSG